MLRLGLPVAAAIAVLDQLSKWCVLELVMQPPRTIPVTSFFNLVLAWNRGISFSLLASAPEASRWLFVALSAAITGGLLVWLARVRTNLLALAIGLIVGGAIGNAVDRVNHGAVVDFIELHAMEFYWPAFNMADSAITVGVVLILWDTLFVRRR